MLHEHRIELLINFELTFFYVNYNHAIFYEVLNFRVGIQMLLHKESV